MLPKVKKWALPGAGFLILIFLSLFLLREDALSYWCWGLLAFVLGMAAMPFTGCLFEGFLDKGYLFSKLLAIAVSGFATWFLTACGIIRFGTASCVGVCIVLAALCFFRMKKLNRNGIEFFPSGDLTLVVWEELVFLAAFLLWAYFAGFNPAAYGTEKFMDYGFMEAMMRSDVMPARDLWYLEGTINYYYGGQYFAVFLTKLSGTRIAVTYNLMRAFVAAFAFAIPFSLVFQLLKDRLQEKGKALVPALGGLLGGTAVSLAGNMHYVIYGQIIPLLQKLRGEEAAGYWFPDATRYIGYNPDVPDKTIHEFPSYSFVLGDLHAHVCNIIFVLLLLGLLYAWTRRMHEQKKALPEEGEESVFNTRDFVLREALHPHVLLVSFLLGIYQWTNYWDFVIYFVVAGGVFLFTNVIRFDGKPGRVFGATLIHAIEMAAVSTLVILPFTLKFTTMMQGVGIAEHHSLPYQLAVLWGLPILVSVLLIVGSFREAHKQKAQKGFSAFLAALHTPDFFAAILALCAMGLILITELVYVRDIYENGYARANTMFKLTYQSYIMFGIVMGYGIFRLAMLSRSLIVRLLSYVALFFLLWTVGYLGNSVHSWYGNVLDVSGRKGLNAQRFLETDFAEDAAAIHWLQDNVKDVSVVLEANGDSYSGFGRVSSSTGLPTILGWYVHEWLWRNDTDDLNRKAADVETIYTSGEDSVRKLLTEYDVTYIFVGSKEKEKYEERLKPDYLKTLGSVVFEDSGSGTFIVKVR